jgi:hypothetical protein
MFGRGQLEQGVAGGDCPRRPVAHRRRKTEAAEGSGAWGVGREEGNEEWDGHELEKLERRRIEA